MKILIKAQDETVSMRVKETLESFGKGMHIFTKDDGFSYYKCVLCIGKERVWDDPELFRKFDEPKTEADWEQLNKELWTFYRDNIKEAFGAKCSCGLFEYCHCH